MLLLPIRCRRSGQRKCAIHLGFAIVHLQSIQCAPLVLRQSARARGTLSRERSETSGEGGDGEARRQDSLSHISKVSRPLGRTRVERWLGRASSGL
ncbi:uncharacterized protein K452DRAFT_49618 [Aplosporella prunicola CBS 121167]|uniref:Uncharacterized protein n=1 Tax=Aplosporella prunicola CBS 121167 TaxID=1176127 RepID=A0A6A6BAN9_9PEZI|nr:uncharacterized protein K452DRAFT_49618 [Aplosporella prunicola CBS 121167]KAF2140658.1 hypothetical protein K452DRAFT_49618 [Aplosporella prunicola CBS 121167]